jgi:cytoskeletal protein RodZ
MERAYGVPVAGREIETTDHVRRIPRAHPNWWVILAVSLALIALLVATGSAPHPTTRHERQIVDSAAGDPVRTTHDTRPLTPDGSGSHHVALAPTTSTTVAAPAQTTTPRANSTIPLLSTPGASSTTVPPASSVTTTTVAPTTTTSTTTSVGSGSVQAADRTQEPGVLDPPGTRSLGYAFSGSGGAMEVAVVWSGATYLTMVVSCPTAGQNVGGTSAMAATLPDATGSCMATVSEPSSESVALTFTITIGPAGG